MVTRYLKPYFDGLEGQDSNVSVSIFSGKLQLGDLKLKSDVCQTLGITNAEVLDGGVDNFMIHVPTSIIGSGHVTINADKITVNLKSSLTSQNKDKTREEILEELREGKNKQIDAYEASLGSLREQREEQEAEEKGEGKKGILGGLITSFSAKVFRRVIETLEVSLNDIQIQFCDVPQKMTLGILAKGIFVESAASEAAKKKEHEFEKKLKYLILSNVRNKHSPNFIKIVSDFAFDIQILSPNDNFDRIIFHLEIVF